MGKRIVEMEDDLQERIDNMKTDIVDDFIQYLHDNPGLDETEFSVYEDTINDSFLHEMAEAATPIYYSNIDSLYYFYGDEFEEAYKNAGIGDGSEENHKSAAIWCYMYERAYEILREMKEIFEEHHEWTEAEDEDDEDFEPEVDYTQIIEQLEAYKETN